MRRGVAGKALRRALAAVFAAIAPFAAEAEPKARSAREFLSLELAAEQADETLNRGMLWVELGERLWKDGSVPSGRSCASCHGQPGGMRGVATRYPAINRETGALVNIEGRINGCRVQHQSLPALAYESEELLALTALVAHQSKGMIMSVAVDGAARGFLEQGRAVYESRQGQLNIACSQCHEQNVGRKLRGDVISSGLGVGYPAYRLTWQGLGSLHRRLKACQQGVRAAEFEPGSTEHLSLELFLAWRARGIPIETPGIRR